VTQVGQERYEAIRDCDALYRLLEVIEPKELKKDLDSLAIIFK
jgi:hypothetical protein